MNEAVNENLGRLASVNKEIDRLRLAKAEAQTRLTSIKAMVGAAKGAVYCGGKEMRAREWSALLNKQAELVSKVRMIDGQLTSAKTRRKELQEAAGVNFEREFFWQLSEFCRERISIG